MSIQQKLQDDMKSAMKSGDKFRRDVIRMILSEMKYAQSAVNVHAALDEVSANQVVAAYHKRLKKSLEDYPEGDKKKEILSEIALVEEYMPRQLSQDELKKIIEDVISHTETRNFGELMKLVTARVGTSADGKTVSQKLKEILP